MSHVQFKTHVDRQKWDDLRAKIANIKKLLVQVHAVADAQLRDIIDANTGNWMVFGQDMEAAGEAYGATYIYSELRRDGAVGRSSVDIKDYHHTEQDFLRGRLLLQKLFLRAAPLSEVRRVIACSAAVQPCAPVKQYEIDWAAA